MSVGCPCKCVMVNYGIFHQSIDPEPLGKPALHAVSLGYLRGTLRSGFKAHDHHPK